MAALDREPLARPFNEGGYEILDEDLSTRREVVIWSVDPLTPRIGDLFTIESGGVVHDVLVIQVSQFSGGWSAVSRVVEAY